jgi:hypothetical protein
MLTPPARRIRVRLVLELTQNVVHGVANSIPELMGCNSNAMEPVEERFSLRTGRLADHLNGLFEHSP